MKEIPTSNQQVVDLDKMVPSKPIRGELVFDLETLPDFSREHLFGLPEVVPYEAKDPGVKFETILSSGVNDIKDFLGSETPSEKWLGDLLEAEALGKARKGVVEAITKAIESIGDAERQQEANNKTMATNPEMGQIVSMGFCCTEIDDVQSLCVGDRLKDSDELVTEWDIIWLFWVLANKIRGPVCGYNIIGFDLPFIFARTIILGVAVEKKRPFDTRPWSNDVVDIMLKRFPSRGQSGKLKDLARYYGIDVPAEGVDGGSVLGLWEEGRMDLINEYVKSDVEITRELMHLFKGTFIV